MMVFILAAVVLFLSCICCVLAYAAGINHGRELFMTGKWAAPKPVKMLSKAMGKIRPGKSYHPSQDLNQVIDGRYDSYFDFGDDYDQFGGSSASAHQQKGIRTHSAL